MYLFPFQIYFIDQFSTSFLELVNCGVKSVILQYLRPLLRYLVIIYSMRTFIISLKKNIVVFFYCNILCKKWKKPNWGLGKLNTPVFHWSEMCQLNMSRSWTWNVKLFAESFNKSITDMFTCRLSHIWCNCFI